MEGEPYEFTIDDILTLHRSWITDLVANERKTEVEIVQLLHERHLVVSVVQIHQCLLEWNVIRSPTTLTNSTVYHQDWEMDPPYFLPPPSSPSSVSKFIMSSKDSGLYIAHPLPPPPSTSYFQPELSLRDINYSKWKTFDKERLKLTHLSGYEDTMSRVELVSGSTSPLENYVLDDQAHERLAMGLDSIPRMMYDRANDTQTSRGRTYRPARKLRRDNDLERRTNRK